MKKSTKWKFYPTSNLTFWYLLITFTSWNKSTPMLMNILNLKDLNTHTKTSVTTWKNLGAIIISAISYKPFLTFKKTSKLTRLLKCWQLRLLCMILTYHYRWSTSISRKSFYLKKETVKKMKWRSLLWMISMLKLKKKWWSKRQKKLHKITNILMFH
jgi:hypothetical protein